MKNRFLKLSLPISLITFYLLFPVQVFATTVSGNVSFEDGRSPGNIQVWTENNYNASTITDNNGNFSINVADGPQAINVKAQDVEGYERVAVNGIGGNYHNYECQVSSVNCHTIGLEDWWSKCLDGSNPPDNPDRENTCEKVRDNADDTHFDFVYKKAYIQVYPPFNGSKLSNHGYINGSDLLDGSKLIYRYAQGGGQCGDQSYLNSIDTYHFEWTDQLTFSNAGTKAFADYINDGCSHSPWRAPLLDSTRPYPQEWGDSVNSASQLIKVPSNISKIKSVRFHGVSGTDTAHVEIKDSAGNPIYSSSSTAATSVEFWSNYGTNWGGHKETSKSFVFDNLDVSVTPGLQYWVRLVSNDGSPKLAVPVASTCDDASKCTYWVNVDDSVRSYTSQEDSSDSCNQCPNGTDAWCNIDDFTDPCHKHLHSISDLYGDGYAETDSSYFSNGNFSQGNKADLARMEVWGDSGDVDLITPTVTPSSSPTPTFTPTLTPTPAPPRIQSSTGDNSGANQVPSGFAGTFGYSGNQSSQGGKNWLNPVTFRVNVTPGTSPVTQYYLAFYEKSSGALLTNSSSFVNNVKLRVNNPGNGFLVAYGTGINPCSPSCSNNSFYVWNGGINKWERINPDDRNSEGRLYRDWGFKINDSSGNVLLTVYPVIAGTDYASWKILFDKNFGNKNLYTAIKVVDGGNLSDFKSNLCVARQGETCEGGGILQAF